ncbi:D-3-phosphoglycerate dehydrogenase [Polystyrenella longa]|uniref:D-3-phosphoglycerate dehydrogenase n=1 Tax=Polystyrenella longa TaxID=2528007 RepID=A0A518CT06_9PLAN|nr:phosphoglycerate dehydrogenase [Polystyrenella longa]QDU82363.1 D-3-phosphoglycerate dehydrogenase [Polystyrenella longa]
MSRKVLITPECLYKQPGRHVELFESCGFEVCYPEDITFTRGLFSFDDCVKVLAPYDAVLAGSEGYPAEMLDALPNLKVIARFGVGYDPVNVPHCTKLEKAVTITPASTHDAVAEMTMGLIFAIAKSIIPNDISTREGAWSRVVLYPVRERLIGLVGLGRIGRSTAIRAKLLGMQVIAHDQFADPKFVKEQGIELVSLEELLQKSDYVSLHAPMLPETKYLINKETLKLMKPDSVLINTARGGLVNEADLLVALTSGQIRAAALDVFEQEPPSPDNPLFQLKNVIASPHMAGLDQVSVANMAHEAAECITQLSKNQWPEGKVVNSELKTSWSW